jgi:hypothetical protein
MPDPDESADKAINKQPDPRVSSGRPDPAAAPARTTTLRGFFGDSDREGFRRLYLTKDLDYYVEFRVDDVVSIVDIPPDRQPFPGEQATEVSLRREATVEFTRTRTLEPPDEFDLDIRFAPRRQARGRGQRSPRNRWTAGFTECCVPYTVEDPTCPETCDPIAWSCEVACWSLVGCPTHEGIDCFTLPGDTGPHASQCPPCFPL